MRTPSPLSILLRPYRVWVISLLLLTWVITSLSLWMPQMIAAAIDQYILHQRIPTEVFWQFGWFVLGIFVLSLVQGIVQSLFAERVAFALRRDMVEKISTQPYAYIEEVSSAKLMTHMTADVESIKTYIAMAVVAIYSSVFIIVGSAALLLWTNWPLALAVLTIVPLIMATFAVIFRKLGPLFTTTRENMDALGAVIQESIVGAALVRVVAGAKHEEKKFLAMNTQAKETGMKILWLFSAMIPTITFIANGATVILIVFGGHLVMTQAMTLGQLSAFMNYVMLFIFPIISLGFLSNFAMQAGASYTRIQGILHAPAPLPTGGLRERPKGTIEVRNLCLERGGRRILHAMSFVIPAGSRVAIVGPTAAGKTQLMQILCGLTAPTSGEVLFDGHPLSSYDPAFLSRHVGVVFQDSVIFQASFAENIGFQSNVHEGAMRKALETAELTQFVDSLPKGLDTMISERGSSLSGGQKQRLMLARALVQDPSILFLDDFTARIDGPTQQRIVQHLAKNYLKATCINITQNIASITTYDQILLLMEGELLGIGTHESLLTSCVEYAQMYTSQHSTNHYELYTDH